MRKITKAAVVGGSVAALMGGGIAFAAWTSTGSGSGTVTAGRDQGLTVAPGTATGLFPTGSQNITVTVTNNNPYKVAMSSVVPGATTVSGNSTICSPNVVSTTARTGLSDVLASGASKDYTFSVSMSNAAQDGCQDATFTIPFTATGASSN